MHRYYFASDDIEDLLAVERELQDKGVSQLQMHVLPSDDATAEKHGIESIDSFSRKDVIRSGFIGFGIGAALLAVVIIGAYLFGVRSPENWLLVGFFGVVILGFCTWEGGLFGIQEPNREFSRFSGYLKKGMSLFYVDVDDSQKTLLDETARRHDHLQSVGEGEGPNTWTMAMRSSWNKFIHSAP